MDSTAQITSGARRRGSWPSSLEATRASLLSRLKHHDDHQAWHRFFEAYGMVIHSLALKAGLSSTEAEDALQETLLSVAREMPGFQYDPSKGSFKAWLLRITRRRIADQFRRRMRQQRDGQSDEQIEDVPDPASDPLTSIWDEEWRQNQFHLAVARVKQKASSRQWQMFDLAALQRWPTERVCALLGVNRAQLYMAKMRVGRLLKAELQRSMEDVPE